MNHCLNAAAAAIAVACLSSAAFAEERETVAAHVSLAGIDPTSAAGRATLRERVARVASIACDSGSRDLAMRSDAERCAREMQVSAAAELAARVGTQQTAMAH